MVSYGHLWISQYDATRVPDAGPTACFRACREMARAGWGVEFPESTEMRIQLAVAEDGPAEIIPSMGAYVMAQELFGNRLKLGLPLIVGIHYKAGSLNRDHITDHFNLLCGVEGDMLVGLNPGAEMHGNPYNAAFMNDPTAHVFRAVVPKGLRAVMSMIIPPKGWTP